ncbi:hypothetical protein MIR68_007149 [Amoeboaphelidium protococcarum]|nr:hypothetical protein MIR68_007149 [Amoeboaphelidium protococcarum]
MSKIFYKFKSQREYKTIVFDGLSISVFDVKREILLQQKLDGVDFDLELQDAASETIYYEDSQMIQRNASLYVRRVPAKAPHSAAKYLAGLGDQNASTSGRDQQSVMQSGLPSLAQFGSSSLPGLGGNITSQSSAAPQYPQFYGLPGLSSAANQFTQAQQVKRGLIQGETEEDQIRQLFEQSGQQWDQQQSQIGQSQQGKMQNMMMQGNRAAGTGRNGQYQNTHLDPNKPPPPNYTCHRCGIKGHYIQFCPTWNNPAFDNIRIKKTTGIPRSFLKTIGNITDSNFTGAGAEGNGEDNGGGVKAMDASSLNPQKLEEMGAKSIMITPEGQVVIAQVNDASFNRQLRRAGDAMMSSRAGGGLMNDTLREQAKQLEESGVEEKGRFMKKNLMCSICANLFKEAVNMDCCKQKYCLQCTQQKLTESAVQDVNNQQVIMHCPNCNKEVDFDSLITDKPMRAQVDLHLRFVAQYLKKTAGTDSGGADGTSTAGGKVSYNSSMGDNVVIKMNDNTKEYTAFYNGVALPYKCGPDGLPVHVSNNSAELARLRFDPHFEPHPSGRIAIYDFTDDRSRIYDSKYFVRVQSEMKNCHVLMSRHSAGGDQSSIIDKGDYMDSTRSVSAQLDKHPREPPAWTWPAYDREMEDLNDYLIKIDGQEFNQDDLDRLKPPPPKSSRRDYNNQNGNAKRQRSPSVSNTVKSRESGSNQPRQASQSVDKYQHNDQYQRKQYRSRSPSQNYQSNYQSYQGRDRSVEYAPGQRHQSRDYYHGYRQQQDPYQSYYYQEYQQ